NNNKDALVDGKEHDDDIQKSVSPDFHSSSSGAQTRVGKGFSGVKTPLFEEMLVSRQPVGEELIDEQVQVDNVVAAAVEEHVAEDVSHDAIPSPPPHAIPSPSHFHLLNNNQRVETLENDNAAQKLEIVKLKARVKKLEKANHFKSSKLRHLRKVGTSRRVESSDDMKDVFNQGRMIDDMDMDERIELVKDDKVVTTAKLITEVVTAAASQEVSAASTTIPAAKPTTPVVVPTVIAAYIRRRKGVTIRDPEEELSLKTPAETPKVKDKGKEILVDTPKPIKKKDQIEMDAEYTRKLQEEIDRDHDGFNKDIDWAAAMDHVNQKSTNPQYIKRYQGMKKRPQTETEDLRKRLEVVEDEDDDVFVKATPLVQKVPVVDYQIVLIDNKPRFKIIRIDETHQFYISFAKLLKNFNREDLETLWRIVKDRFSTSKPTNFSDEYLLLTLRTMFEEPDGQDAIWRNQKSVHGLALVKR
nr:hypothetical protein [Tanacetum cinerariifolium]